MINRRTFVKWAGSAAAAAT
ncbi:twin-arginine translocation signal domain-containing protein, partial [Candidatus Sumerlaeota bacterium]|nr:twin-arginine translocation signal domain-containing protein [Candidatus Sumerlaeota bacterium]